MKQCYRVLLHRVRRAPALTVQSSGLRDQKLISQFVCTLSHFLNHQHEWFDSFPLCFSLSVTYFKHFCKTSPSVTCGQVEEACWVQLGQQSFLWSTLKTHRGQLCLNSDFAEPQYLFLVTLNSQQMIFFFFVLLWDDKFRTCCLLWLWTIWFKNTLFC